MEAFNKEFKLFDETGHHIASTEAPNLFFAVKKFKERGLALPGFFVSDGLNHNWL